MCNVSATAGSYTCCFTVSLFHKDFSKSSIQEWGRSERALTGVDDDVPTTFLPVFILGGMIFRFKGTHTRCLKKCVKENGRILNEMREIYYPNVWKLVSNHTNLKRIDKDKWFWRRENMGFLWRFWIVEKWKGLARKREKIDLGWLGMREEKNSKWVVKCSQRCVEREKVEKNAKLIAWVDFRGIKEKKTWMYRLILNWSRYILNRKFKRMQT